MREDPSRGTPAATKSGLVAVLVVTLTALAAFLWLRPDERIDPRFAGWFLWLFSGLFLVRVVGQLVVRWRAPRWLPPMEQWNLTPYQLLLPSQLIILAVMAWIDASFSAGAGLPVTPRPAFGWVVLAFAAVYAGAMVARYVVRMAQRPEERWFGGTIPIVFHWVLAAYLVVYGAYDVSY
jgi:hypothetical protein